MQINADQKIYSGQLVWISARLRKSAARLALSQCLRTSVVDSHFPFHSSISPMKSLNR